MKRIFIFAVIIMSMVGMVHAQSVSKNYWSDDTIKASAIGYVGANFSEPAPIYGAALGLNYYFVRAELEFGGTSIDPGMGFSKRSFFYFSPSIGLSHTFAKRYELYLMSSWINWGYTILKEAPNNECGRDVFDTDFFHWRVKLGTNINFYKKWFANVELGYMFPKAERVGYVRYKNLSLRVGVGYRF